MTRVLNLTVALATGNESVTNPDDALRLGSVASSILANANWSSPNATEVMFGLQVCTVHSCYQTLQRVYLKSPRLPHQRLRGSHEYPTLACVLCITFILGFVLYGLTPQVLHESQCSSCHHRVPSTCHHVTPFRTLRQAVQRLAPLLGI